MTHPIATSTKTSIKESTKKENTKKESTKSSISKVWDIFGGIHPPENKQQSNSTPIASIPLASELIIPLNQHIGEPAEPIVTVGQQVKKGEPIALAQSLFSVNVHASSSGEISAIENRLIPHSSGMSALCIVIKTDGKETWTSLDSCESIESLCANEIVEKIRLAGIAGMGGAGFPTAIKTSPKSHHTIDTLIINGTECEPYITADDTLMRERAHEIIQGIKILIQALNQPINIIVGIEDNKPEAIAAMEKATDAQDTSSNINIVSFPTKYPSGGEKQLIQILTGKEVPQGQIPAHIGIVMMNVGTTHAIYRAIRFGEPLISRVTTVVGKSLTKQQNINVPLGTPIQHILEHHGYKDKKNNSNTRLIIGGPMMGFTIEHSQIPVIKTTNCILAPSQNEMPAPPPAQGCIRCGMCSQVCPANLLPQQLYWFSRAQEFEKLESHHLFDCIECGACSYVCPSNIPLVQYYRASKGQIKKINIEKEKADRSRERFEFRKLRIEKSNIEKEAKRLARKKAAEEAKKLLQGIENNQEKDTPSNIKSNLVLEAVNKATKNNTDIDADIARYQRLVSSNENRINGLKQKITDANNESPLDQTKIDRLSAQLKQAEVKCLEASKKLTKIKISTKER